jgi:radical SAM superfamily enzyme YgiQ (UPF0313 family)
MKVLLFNPWIHDFAAFDHWTRPLNLLRLASLLLKCGCEVDFYDCLNRRSLDLDEFRAPPRHRLNPWGCGHYYRESIPLPEILEFVPRQYKRYGIPPERVKQSLQQLDQPDVVVISTMMTYWYPGVFEAVEMMRQVFPKAKVIIGGIYAVLCREHAEQHSGADAVISGPHWPSIVNQILDIAGNSSSPCEGDQSTWIEPCYDYIKGDPCLPLLTSTGCPCHCVYCATHKLWPKCVQYGHDDIINSIERMENEFGATDAAFYDDALLIKKETHLMPIMETLIRKDSKIRFHTPNALHVRQINRETAHLMKRAGFVTLRLGLEVIEKDLQKETGGKVYTEEYIQAVRYLREAGFSGREIGTYILYGMPGQTIEAVWEACQLVVEQGSEVKLAMYSPIPGTPAYEKSLDEFIFDPSSDPLLHNSSLAPWRSKTIPYERYQEMKKKVASLNQNVRKSPSEGAKTR